jgi:hypothetical protein
MTIGTTSAGHPTRSLTHAAASSHAKAFAYNCMQLNKWWDPEAGTGCLDESHPHDFCGKKKHEETVIFVHGFNMVLIMFPRTAW